MLVGNPLNGRDVICVDLASRMGARWAPPAVVAKAGRRPPVGLGLDDEDGAMLIRPGAVFIRLRPWVGLPPEGRARS